VDLGLKDKVAFVTGCGSPIGFGRRICAVLAEEGCKIAGADIDAKGTEETIGIIKETGAEGIAFAFDVRDRAAVDAAVKKTIDTFGKIDILVNCAGASYSHNTSFVDQKKEEWYFDIEVNLVGQMNVAQSILPHMIERKSGKIVNFSGGRGIPGLSTYGAAKGGVIEWSYALATEVAKFNVSVNIFGPGLSHTGLTKGQSDEFMQFVTNTTRQKRLCTPEDVAPIIAFMVSDKNSYMTGGFVSIGG